MTIRGWYDDARIGDLCVLLECQKECAPGTCEQCMQEIGGWGRGTVLPCVESRRSLLRTAAGVTHTVRSKADDI